MNGADLLVRIMRRQAALHQANASGLPAIADLIRQQSSPVQEATAILAAAFDRRAEAINEAREKRLGRTHN